MFLSPYACQGKDDIDEVLTSTRDCKKLFIMSLLSMNKWIHVSLIIHDSLFCFYDAKYLVCQIKPES